VEYDGSTNTVDMIEFVDQFRLLREKIELQRELQHRELV
jgi:hypothetical protein